MHRIYAGRSLAVREVLSCIFLHEGITYYVSAGAGGLVIIDVPKENSKEANKCLREWTSALDEVRQETEMDEDAKVKFTINMKTPAEILEDVREGMAYLEEQDKKARAAWGETKK